jgi:hypothetical protein
VLIQVGAALTARDRVVAAVNDVVSSYSTPARTQATLRRLERRGASARKQLEREVKGTRTRLEGELGERRRRVEGELRERRLRLERTVDHLEQRSTRTAKDLSARIEQAQARVENAVQSGIHAGADLVGSVQSKTPGA